MLEDKYKYINSLVIKCKAGDNESIFELYEFYRPLMLSSISRCVAKEPKLSVYKAVSYTHLTLPTNREV